jgi:uncharacterized glyoxalase superfamily protein PhnB
MPATVQPVIVSPSIPLLLAFYKALFGAVEISRVPEEGPAFFVGLQIGNAELGVVADGDAHVDAPQRILLNVNVGDLGVGNVADLLEHVEALGGRVLGPPNDMPWGQRVASSVHSGVSKLPYELDRFRPRVGVRCLVRGVIGDLPGQETGRQLRKQISDGMPGLGVLKNRVAGCVAVLMQAPRQGPGHVGRKPYVIRARAHQEDRPVTSVIPRSGSVALGQAPLPA